MSKTAKKVIEQAKSWIGCNEADGSFKKIIDLYNSHKPLARGYKVKYTDEWCATGVSAVSIALGYTDIIPTECGCQKMIDLFKKLGSWIENENRTPAPGEIIFYNWQAKATGDDTGWADHVGIVEEVKNGIITVIEFNYKSAVGRRKIDVNHRNIRGYAVPKYDTEEVKTVTLNLQELRKGSTGEQVEVVQRILASYGYSLGSKNPYDGSFGPKTDAAVREFQADNSLPITGKVDEATWASLLGV